MSWLSCIVVVVGIRLAAFVNDVFSVVIVVVAVIGILSHLPPLPWCLRLVPSAGDRPKVMTKRSGLSFSY